MIKNILGYEGLYVINDSGIDEETVFSVLTNDYLKPKEWKGYKFVQLSKNGEHKEYALHRLIAQTFVPNPDNKPFVDHIVPISNGGTNNPSNLRWVTAKENSNNPFTSSNQSNAQRNNPLKSFKVHQITKDGEVFRVWESVGECARNGYNKGHVAACCRGEQRTHKGYIWRYVNNK